MLHRCAGRESPMIFENRKEILTKGRISLCLHVCDSVRHHSTRSFAKAAVTVETLFRWLYDVASSPQLIRGQGNGRIHSLPAQG